MKGVPIPVCRMAVPLLCTMLVFGAGGPVLDLVSEAMAAPSGLVNRLKRKIRRLKRQVRIARQPVPRVPGPTPGMVMIPAGTFVMGDETNGLGFGDPDELPKHSVTVSAFYMDRFEVTENLYKRVADWGEANGYTAFGAVGSSFHAKTTVSWDFAARWCNARSEMEGRVPVYYTDATQSTVFRNGVSALDIEESFVKWEANGFRLPTEAEWERAARGTLAGNTYPWGGSMGPGHANYSSSGDPFEIPGGSPDTTPVGYYDGGQVPTGPDRANGFGLYDMAGNVGEWCWDRYNDSYYAVSPATNPRGPAVASTAGMRVIRGGDWTSTLTRHLRCAARDSWSYTNSPTWVGFRTVQSK